MALRIVGLLWIAFCSVVSLAETTPPPSPPPATKPFNEMFAKLRAESQKPVPACRAFLEALSLANGSKAPDAETSALLTQKVELLAKWPAFPNAQVGAIQAILRSKNPPVDLDAAQFLDDYSKLDTCEFAKTVEIVSDIQDLLKQDKVPPELRKKSEEELESYLHRLTNKPGPMIKVAVGVALADFLMGRGTRKYTNKERMIRRLKDQISNKSGNLKDALTRFAGPAESPLAVWNETHDAEKLRMELARIIFFP